MADSIIATATLPDQIEVVVYVDDDDRSYDDIDLGIRTTWVRGPRSHNGLVNLSVMWNCCYVASTGDILMHCGDDIVFRTQGWDDVVRSAFDAVPDKILFAFGRDGYQVNFGTHGFVHRTWIDTVGYLFPPLFVSDFNDTFLNDVSKLVGRHQEIDILTEHMHYIMGKAEVDQNTRERLARHELHRPDVLYGGDEVQALIRAAADALQRRIDT